MSDEPRLLAKGLGYTPHPSRALRHEPEALSEADVEQITEEARDRVRHERRFALRMELERVMKSHAHYTSLVRHCERQATRLRREISEIR